MKKIVLILVVLSIASLAFAADTRFAGKLTSCYAVAKLLSARRVV